MIAERESPFAAVAETHTAVVFFAGDRAYKLKKPVRTGFLDFSTPALREAACHRETELNRRFAPDVYLGVAEVRGPDGTDHLVVMRRMPTARRLSALVSAGEPVGTEIRQVARILAGMHAAAPRGAQISAEGTAEALSRRWSDNVEQTRPLAAGLVADADIDEVARLAGRFVGGRGPLFDLRIRGGHIVDGHGDLLADDIFCLADGPRILDCLEFDDTLRWLDGLDDAACLAMDLERLGAAALAGQFMTWYAEYSGDPAPPSLRQHYIAYRAFMRAKVSCLRASQGDASAGREAGRLTDLALRHLRAGAVTLVLIGGLPGTGKTALAGALAGQLGWTVLSSDRVRKELAGVAGRAKARFGEGIYSPEWTERTYAELGRRAGALLATGESVILDATWTDAGHRAAAAAVARRASVDLVQIRRTAPAEVAASRIRERVGSDSDADSGVANLLAAAEHPWPEATTLDAGGADEAPAVNAALHAIRPHGSEHVWRSSEQST